MCVDSMLGRIGMVCGLYLKGPWVGRRLGWLSKGEKGQRVLGGNGCIQTMWVPDARMLHNCIRSYSKCQQIYEK